MADLRVEFAGLELKNPLISAASSLGNHLDKLRRLEAAGIGAVTTKLISSAVQPPEHEFPYRMAWLPSQWLLAGEQNLSLEYGVDLVRAAKRELSIPVIANFVGVGANVDSWVQNALALQAAGADAIEMDLYAPMAGPGTDIEDHPDGGHGYLSICAFPEELGAVMAALADAIDIPVIPKMNPFASSLVEVARSLIDNGATALVMSNVADGNPGVDIRDGGRSAMQHAAAISSVPMLGHYLFAWHNGTLVLLKAAFGDQVQVGTGGGVYTWEEIVQRVMLGGRTVQLCSTIYENGPAVITESLASMSRYMDEYGYRSLDQMEGISLGTVGRRAATAVEPAVARIVDRQALVGRGPEIVQKVSGDCLAMSLDGDDLPQIDPARCTGCGWCVHHAGDGSIELVRTDRFVSDLDLGPTSTVLPAR